MHLNALIYMLINYFRISKNIQVLYILNCRDRIENAKLSRELSSSEISTKIVLLDETLNTTNIIQDFSKFHENLHSLGIFLDYNCDGSHELLSTCEQCFSTRFKWFIYENGGDDESRAIDQFKELNLFIDAEIALMMKNRIFEKNKSLHDVYSLYDVYNNGYSRGGKLNITFDRYFVFSNKNEGYFSHSLVNMKTKYENRYNMSDVTLRLGIVYGRQEDFNRTEDLINYLLTDNNTSVDTLPRHFANIGYLITDALNFNKTWLKYKKWTENETYGAMVEAVAMDQIDFALALFLITLDRSQYFWPISQINEFRSQIYFLTITETDYFGDYFLKPFSNFVWFIIGVAIIFVMIAYKLVSWNDHILAASSFVATFGVFCQQGSEVTPKLISGKCVLIFILLLSLTLYNYYTSVLVSTLVKSGSRNRIKNIRDLADSPLKVGFEEVPYIRGFLNNTDEQDVKYLTSKKFDLLDPPNDLFIPSIDGVRLMQHHRFAFHCDANTAFPLIQRIFTPLQICNLNVIRFRRDKMQGIVTRKNSPFHDIFAIKIFWMRETGIVSKHQRHWVAPQPKCMANALFTSVTLRSTAAAIIVLVVGYILALIILILEIVHNFYYTK